MRGRLGSNCVATCYVLLSMSVCGVVFAGTGEKQSAELRTLNPEGILAQLVQEFPTIAVQSTESTAQYLVVQQHLNRYVDVIGDDLSVQRIAPILDSTQQNEVLQANVFVWLYQSGVLKRMDEQKRFAVYQHIEKTVKQSQGQAFQVGVGLLRRLLEPEGVNAAGNEMAARKAAAAILEMTRERLMQGVHSDKEDAVVRSVLEDVRKLRKRNMLEAKPYEELLRTCVTNRSMSRSVRVRSASLLFHETTNKAEVIRLLRSEADNSENDEALRKHLRDLLEKGLQ